MKKILSILTIAVLVLGSAGCKKRDNSIPNWPWHDPDDPDGEWVDVTADYGFMPEYVQVLQSPSRLQNKNAVAYIARVDMTKTDMNVWAINDPELDGSSDALRTPKECYEAVGKPCIVINGGYFYSDSGINYPASLAISNGTLLSPNINYASEDWVVMYYPTRGVFLQQASGFIAGWTYFQDADHHYLYTAPAANAWGATPLQVPDENFPTASQSVVAKNGVGGGPVLIKNGEIVCTYRQELFNGETSGILCDTRHPRTAIGITADKHLVMFVCEGREMTTGVPGYTLDELAKIMLAQGCVEAMNLDGGGSTCMLVNGKETVKPSDGEERPVGCCIYITK